MLLDFQRVGDVLWRSAIGISNFYFWRESDYFDVSSFYKPLLHTWSLGVEEQFYLLWPASLLLILRLKRVKPYLPVFALCVVSYALVYLFQDGTVTFLNERINNLENGKSSTFFLLPFRIFEFLIGALTVWISQKDQVYRNDILSLLGFLMIIIPGMAFSETLVHPSMLNIIPCAGSALLIYSGSSSLASKILTSPFFRWTGKYSYSLYLVHWPLIVFYRYYRHASLDFSDQVLVFALTYVFAYIIGELIERPFRYGQSRFYLTVPSYFVSACLLFIAIFFFTGRNIDANKGWTWRISPEQQALIKDLGDPKEFHRTNFGGVGYGRMTCIGKSDSVRCDTFNAILIGDSHAQQYGNALEKIVAREHGVKIQLIQFSLIFLPDFKRNDREDDYQKTFESLFNEALQLGNSNPRAVYCISQSWQGMLGVSDVMVDSTSGYRKLQYDSIGFRAVLTKLKKLKQLLGTHKLVVFGGVPGAMNGELPLNALLRPSYFTTLVRNQTSSLDSLGRSFELNNLFAARLPQLDGVYFINPYDALCEGGKCFSVIDNKVMYSDMGHLSKAGADRVIRHFEKKLAEIIKHEMAPK